MLSAGRYIGIFAASVTGWYFFFFLVRRMNREGWVLWRDLRGIAGVC